MKTGLALGGGGAKGAYQIGVLKALDQMGFMDNFEVYSGASIGALNAYFYLGSNEIDEVIKAWEYGIKNNPVESKKINKGKKRNSFSFDVIRKMAQKYVDVNRFYQAEKDVYVILTKVKAPKFVTLLRKKTWEKVTVKLNDVDNPLEYAISSSSLPLFFGFSEIADDYYIDGGLLDNNPVEILVEKGCRIVFVCSLDNNFSVSKYDYEDVVFVNLTAKEALPKTKLKSMWSIIDFKEALFVSRMEYGYQTGLAMIDYLVDLGLYDKIDNKYVVNKNYEGEKNIDIPKYINQMIKNMRKSKKGRELDANN